MSASPPSITRTDVQFLFDAEGSGESTTAFIARVALRAQTPPAHKHDDGDETVYCTQGTMSYVIDGDKIHLAQGEAVCVRRGQTHKFDNIGPLGRAVAGPWSRSSEATRCAGSRRRG